MSNNLTTESGLLVEELLWFLKENLIPWSLGTAAPLVRACPPWREYSGVRIQGQVAPLLRLSERKLAASLMTWPQDQINASQFPCICCVLEGPIDWRAGITERMIAENLDLDPVNGRYILRLPTQTFLVVPAGAPHDDGSKLHWLDAKQKAPDSRIFWISAQPAGVTIHTCRTSNGIHRQTGGFFLKDSHALALMEFLIDDLQGTSPPPFRTARQYLNLILLRLEHALASESGSPVVTHTSPKEVLGGGAPLARDAALVEGACRYIRSHFSESLTVETIASHSYVSSTHLTRLFRRELGISPMAYLEQQRMSTARSLLLQSRMTVYDISNFLGYKHHDIFRRAFVRHFGCSPTTFRSRDSGSTEFMSRPLS